MSHFLVLNFQDFGLQHRITETIQSQTLFCVCCLEKNAPLLDLTKCEHRKYLDIFTKPKLINKYLVCYHCHAVLRKIEHFRQQVEESFRTLETTTLNNIDETENIRKIKFSTKKTVDVLLKGLKPVSPSSAKIVIDSGQIKIGKDGPSKIKENSAKGEKNQSKETYTEAIAGKNVKNSGKGTSKDKIKSRKPRILIIAPRSLKTSQNKVSTCIVDPLNVDTESENVDMTPENDMKVDIVNEVTESLMEIKSEPVGVVNEFDDAITVTETELQKPQPSVSKIKNVKLTKDELMTERVQIAQSAEYLQHRHRCATCLVGFDYEENIQDHWDRKHRSKPGSVKCEVCSQVVHPPASLNAHYFRHYTRFQCELCNERFTEYKEAQKHYRIAHERPEARYKCQKCDYFTRFHNELVKHRLKHQAFTCKYCGLVVSSPSGMRSHLITAHKKILYSCRKCRTVYENEKSYIAHMRTHSKNPRCDPCNATFSSWHSYNAHLALSTAHATAADRYKYKCEQCSQRFSSATFLRIHASMRHGARYASYQCVHCSKLFTMALELKQHLSVAHRENRIALCTVCKKAYKNSVHLRRHVIEAHAGKLKFAKTKEKKKVIK